MKKEESNYLKISDFYPKELIIQQVHNEVDSIFIDGYVKSSACCCPRCGTITEHRHGTYVRKVHDLPILGKTTWLRVRPYEYQCDNPECETRTFAEDLDGFLRRYGRTTERLERFLCMLALETSCEACSRISKGLGIRTSNETIIHMLERRYESQPSIECGSIIGVDDFALRKGQSYGTIIIDSESHKPVALLQDRDGNELREWLKQNKQVKAVTRDRANAYTKAIADVLPDCMQIADRFHLYQNLSNAIKTALQSEVPSRIKIDAEISSTEETDAANLSAETREKNRKNLRTT